VATVTDLGNFEQSTLSQTVTMTVGASVALNMTVMVFVLDTNSSNNTSSTAVTDSKGNSYAFLYQAPKNANTAALNVFGGMTTVGALTTSDTITYTTVAGFVSTTMALEAASVLGYNATLDSAVSANNTAFGTPYTVTSGTAGASNECFFGWVNVNSGTAGAAGGSWNALPGPFTSWVVSWQVNTGTGALTYTGTTGSFFWTDLIIALQASGGGSIPAVISNENASTWRRVDVIGY
jgi:hypothetical protein